jgi:hypothetical protein
MSAWDEESGFGYSERNIENSRLEVTYVGPFLRTQLRATSREDDIKRARARAEDLALWRAAELAMAGNYAALKIEHTRSDVTVESYDENPHIVRYGLSHSQGRYRYIQSRTPELRSAWLRAKAVITVILNRKPGENDLDAARTVDRMAKKHAGARIYPAY